jgi:hypothetical protein
MDTGACGLILPLEFANSSPNLIECHAALATAAPRFAEVRIHDEFVDEWLPHTR